MINRVCPGYDPNMFTRTLTETFFGQIYTDSEKFKADATVCCTDLEIICPTLFLQEG